MQPGKNLHLPYDWYFKINKIHKNNLQCFLYLQDMAFLIRIGPIKGVLLNLVSYSLGQLFLRIKL